LISHQNEDLEPMDRGPLEQAAEPFRFFRQFDGAETSVAPSSRSRLRPVDARWFPGDGLGERLARELCALRAVPLKEMLEAFEFFVRVRRRVRAPVVADLCCGHGLVGVLYALYERKVEQVLLLDRRQPDSWQRVAEAARKVGPWTADKITYRQARLEHAAEHIPSGSALVAVHACGLRTDRVLELAIAVEGPVAVLPCCRPHGRHPAPEGLRNALGADLAIDVDRTYTLERAGYRVRWDAIPAAITPMHRILMAVPRREG
jgi:hypothetical protein